MTVFLKYLRFNRGFHNTTYFGDYCVWSVRHGTHSGTHQGSLSPVQLAPTQVVPVVREVSDHRSLDLTKWGLVPSWAKDLSIASQLINAR